MTPLTPTTVYVPVKASERLPEQTKDAEFVIYGSANSKGTLHKDYFKKWNVAEWLDKKEGYFLTKEEMKKLIGAAIDEVVNGLFNEGFEIPNPEQYQQSFINKLLGK